MLSSCHAVMGPGPACQMTLSCCHPVMLSWVPRVCLSVAVVVSSRRAIVLFGPSGLFVDGAVALSPVGAVAVPPGCLSMALFLLLPQSRFCVFHRGCLCLSMALSPVPRAQLLRSDARAFMLRRRCPVRLLRCGESLVFGDGLCLAADALPCWGAPTEVKPARATCVAITSWQQPKAAALSCWGASKMPDPSLQPA
jgi:hypothetical protein